MQSFTTRYWTPFMATSTAIALWLAALTGCRSAVDDFYNPLLTPPSLLLWHGRRGWLRRSHEGVRRRNRGGRPDVLHLRRWLAVT